MSKERNSTSTTTGPLWPKITIAELSEMLAKLSEPPKIIAVDFTKLFCVRVNDYIPENTIIVSKKIAQEWGLWKQEAE